MSKLKSQKSFLLSSLIILISFFYITKKPTYAFFPTIYEPNKKELKNTSIKIGQTVLHLLNLNQKKEALQLAELAIKLNPEENELWIILAESQAKNNLFKKAHISLEKAIEIEPKRATTYFAKASLYVNNNQPIDAIKYVKKGLSLEPQNASGYFQLGNTQILLKKFKNALISFKKAYNIEPKFWQAINNEGIVLYELNKKKEAIRVWKKVIKIHEDAEPILALAAAIYNTKGNNIESIELAKKALSKNPSYIFEEYQKEQLWGKKLREAAKDLFKNPALASTVEKALSNAE